MTINSISKNNLYNFVKDTPLGDIQDFMLLRNCQNTVDTYWNHYNTMFWELLKKEYHNITWFDIASITTKKIKDARSSFIKQGFSATTINQRVYACKKLWKCFIENGRVKENPFILEDLMEEENNYGSLTIEELRDFFEYCKKLKHKPNTQYLYFKFLFITSCRKSVAQNLFWSDIKREKDSRGIEFWVISYHNKGSKGSKKTDKIAITDTFYEELLDNYNSEYETSGKVFNVHDNTLRRTLEGFCDNKGINRVERNIVQHSIRSTSSDHIQAIFGNIFTVAKALKHKNIQTAYRKYTGKNQDYSKSPSIILDGNFNVSELEGLSKEDILKLLERAGEEVVTKLCLEVRKDK